VADIKQVIVMRNDLGMRKGKMVAQGAHASIAFLTRRIQTSEILQLTPAELEWINGIFAKVCVKVNSEQELLDIYEQAKAAGLETHLITDRGLTEFHGQSTHTCVGIGPDFAEKIDAITGHLSLM
jgi:PTH2 family peptidyl-tRNA hydrolase